MFYELLNWISTISSAFVTGCARVYVCMYIVSAFSFKEVKGILLHSATLVFVFIPALFIHENVNMINITGTMFIIMIIKECLLGLMLGSILVIPFWLFESVGSLFDNQRGVLMGEQINPALTSSSSLFGYVLKNIFLLSFICNDGFARLTGLIWRSYLFWPVDSLFFADEKQGVITWLSFISETFSFILVYSAPFAVLLLLIEFSIALLSLYSPKMQATLIAIPTKIIISTGFLILYIPFLVNLSEKHTMQQENHIQDISSKLKLLKH